MSKNIKINLVTLGNELLLGIRPNTHLNWIGSELAQYGVTLSANVTFGDSDIAQKDAMGLILDSSDILITTGGLGPTSDDNTREMLANVLGLELVFDEEIKACIEDRFKRMNRPMGDIQLKQCFRFKEAEILKNNVGTAPGIFLQHNGKIIICLPGPSQEMRTMFEEQVLPRLIKMGIVKKEKVYVQMRTMGVSEVSLQEMLTPFLAKYPGIEFGYCAHLGAVDVRITCTDGRLSYEELKKIAVECSEVIGEDFICLGHCPLGLYIFEYLRGMERTLAVAESCTGGLLSSVFTDIPGASKVFLGGFVCYQNEAKVQMLGVPEALIQQHGAVSAEVAAAMATGAAERLGASHAISITGFAGPGGGTEKNPVGTIFIGYHSPVGVWARRVVYPDDRLVVKERAVMLALDWVRRKLRKYQLQEMSAD